MKSFRLPARLLLCWLGFSGLSLSPVSVSAYDPPDFNAEVFSPDGIFLPGDQKTSLLEALAAIASNFPENSRVDDDLREKALALALRLDPLHYHSRLAHRELSKGAKPNPTSYFDSLSVVSETLWTLANQLSLPPFEPEQKRLAPFLMELSLVTHPDPPDERLEAYAGEVGGKSLPWDRFTTLQPDTNRSTTRAQFLWREGLAILNQPKPEIAKTGNGPAQPADTAPMTAVDSPSTPLPRTPPRPVPVEPLSNSLVAVRQVTALEPRPIAGTVTLTIRTPRGVSEREWLEQQAGVSPIPLIPSDEAIPVEGLDIPASLATAQSWTWPVGTLGEVTFSPSAPPPGPRRLIRTEVRLPTVILIESTLRKAPINDEIIVAGEIDSLSLEPVLPGGALATIQAAAVMNRKYLLVPAQASEDLITYLMQSGQLDILFTTELVSYSNLAGAITRITTPTDAALAGASVVFREIEAVSERMPLPDLARNAKVQERLESILATCPEHLSARAMLEFGRRPETPEMRAAQFAGRVKAVVEPFWEIDDPDVDFTRLNEHLESARTELSRLRTDVPIEGREFLATAEDLIEAAQLYLGLSNKDSSIAIQRLRETKEAIALLEEQGRALGISFPEDDEEE